jgi:hypothetical protein
MSEDAHHEADHDHGSSPGRVTSPMQEYTTSQVAFGGVILGIGLAVTFGLGLAL